MAKTTVDHVNLTVSTVDVFIKTMQYICENDLWHDARTYLAEHGKTEMFFDHEVLSLFREMLKQHKCFNPEHPAVQTVLRHK